MGNLSEITYTMPSSIQELRSNHKQLCYGLSPHHRAVVLGAGISGVAAARLLNSFNVPTVVLDEAENSHATKVFADLPNVTYFPRYHAFPGTHFDLCIVSPSFSDDHVWLQTCKARNIPVISELELGFAHWPGRILAITGSKGKSSITKLCADTLNQSNIKASPAGNYGIPLSELAHNKPDVTWAITEVSSFQLEHIRLFRPDIAILLNIHPDHLDRHGNMQAYMAAKLNLFANQRTDDIAILPDDLKIPDYILPAVKRMLFGAHSTAVWRYGKNIVSGEHGNIFKIDLKGSWFNNDILGVSAAAAIGALAMIGLAPEQIQRGVKIFVPLPHRMQVVGEFDGIHFINDSKATTLTALAAALKMSPSPVYLIAGGILKETDVEFIKDLLAKKARKVYLIGTCRQIMYKAWRNVTECIDCGDLKAAFEQAVTDAKSGDTIILSPGCASYDQFANYQERGQYFTRLVHAVVDTRKHSKVNGD